MAVDAVGTGSDAFFCTTGAEGAVSTGFGATIGFEISSTMGFGASTTIGLGASTMGLGAASICAATCVTCTTSFGGVDLCGVLERDLLRSRSCATSIGGVSSVDWIFAQILLNES